MVTQRSHSRGLLFSPSTVTEDVAAVAIVVDVDGSEGFRRWLEISLSNSG